MLLDVSGYLEQNIMMVMVKSSVLKADLLLKGSHSVMVLIMKKYFSPVAHMSSIHTLLAFEAEKKVHQLDVVSAF